MAAAPPSAKPTSPAIQRRTGTRWGYILAGSALGLITSVAIWFGVTGRPPAAPRVVPLTSFPGSESHPSFSPDGSQVAFSWVGEAQDNFDIYVKLIGPGGTLRLTTDAAADRSPAWSPDGQQIAFLRELGDGNAAVVLVPPIGGTERRIAEIQIPVTRDAASAYFGTSLAWSPDGKYLAAPDFDSPDSRPVPAFDSLDSRPGIFLLSIQESQKRRLTLPPPQAIDDRRPAFSPDGRTLAFQRYSASAVTHLYTVPVAGGEPKRLTSFNGQPRGLTWTADGIEIIYTRGLELWRIPAAGGEARRLLGVVGNAGEPVISATGNRLAYSHRQRDLNIWGLETGAAGTSQPSQLIASTRRDSGPQFSPDGGRIAFWSDRSGSPEIWVCDRNGSNVLQLTSFRGPHTGTPRWSPNGQHLVFDSRVDGNPEIMTITSSGSSLRRLTNHEAEDNVPSWSADGRWIYFASNRSGEMQVWKLPAGGGAGEDAAAVQVTQNGGFAPFESPDGKNVYYAKTRGAKNAIWRVPVGGGAESPVIDSINSGWGHWALTGEGIYFVDREDPASLEQPWEIKSYRFADGRILKIADFHETLAVEDSGLSVSPDGRWLLCVGAESESDLMLLENFR